MKLRQCCCAAFQHDLNTSTGTNLTGTNTPCSAKAKVALVQCTSVTNCARKTHGFSDRTGSKDKTFVGASENVDSWSIILSEKF